MVNIAWDYLRVKDGNPDEKAAQIKKFLSDLEESRANRAKITCLGSVDTIYLWY